MRICIATRRYPVVTETFVHDSAVGLRTLGHDIRAVASRRGRRLDGPVPGPPAQIVGGLSRLRSRIRPWIGHPRLVFSSVMRLRNDTGARFRALWDVPFRAQLEEVAGADCILAHFGYVGVEWLPAAALAHVRFAVYFHGSDATRWIRRSPRMYDALFASGVGIITNCEFLRACLIQAGADPTRTRVVPLSAGEAFATAPAPPRLTAPRISVIARLVPKKGVDDAIAAFARASEHLPPVWQCHVGGDGPERQPLARLARNLGLRARVQFTREASRDQILRTLNESSLFVLASRTAPNGDTEGTPIALIEAATLGVPCVATAHAGIPEILPPEARRLGYLVEERDRDGLAVAIVRLARSHEERARWGQACLAHARLRSQAREARDLSDALETLAKVPTWRDASH